MTAETLGLGHLPGRCAGCGYHVRTQGCHCLPTAPVALRDSALAAVTASAVPDVKAVLEASIRRHAATGRVFSANDLRAEVDVTGPVVGAVFGQLSRAGVIEHVGYEHSSKASTKAHDIKTWRGVAA